MNRTFKIYWTCSKGKISVPIEKGELIQAKDIYMFNKIKTETFLNPEKEMSVLAQWLAV